MRKRTRKHRGTAGKMVGGFLAFFCLILLTAGMFWAIQGYVSYQKAVKEKPLAQAVEEIRSEAQWVPLKQVPELYKKAVLAVEDHRYYTHHGIDWISMARAVVHDIRVMKPEQGGSTITQQLVKNMYYDQNKTLARKAAEAWTALYVERQLSKEEILELYINTIYFGDGYYASCDTRMHVATTTIDKLEDYLFNTPQDPHRSPDCVKQRCELISKNLELLKNEK